MTNTAKIKNKVDATFIKNTNVGTPTTSNWQPHFKLEDEMEKYN